MKIGIPTLVFSGLYTILRMMELVAHGNVTLKDIWEIVNDILCGWPYYHMWYMFMLIGVYIFAPFVIIIKEHTKYDNFRKIACVFLVYAVLSAWTNKGFTVANWGIGYSIYFFGYFMVGYVLRRDSKKNSKLGILLIALGILIEILTAFFVYEFMIIRGIEDAQQYLKPLSPQIVIASILIFYGFGCLSLKYNQVIGKIGHLSFIIYMFHGGVWGGLKTVIGKMKGDKYILSLDNIWMIPGGVLIVFIISLVLSVVYDRINAIVKKIFWRLNGNS